HIRHLHSFPTRRSSDLPIEVNYVDVSNTSQEFEDLLDENPYLSNTFEDQFIPGMRYTFNLNTQLQDPGEIMYASTAGRQGHFFLDRKSTRLNSSHVKIS